MFLLEAYFLPFVCFVAVVLLFASVRILREYERAVVFTLGRFQRVKGPGLVLLIPFIQEMVRVDLRIQVIEIPSQDVISRDNVSMKDRSIPARANGADKAQLSVVSDSGL